jgi:ribosomal protein L30/L7E
MREALKALGLGKLYAFSELPDTQEVRSMIAKVPHLLSILDGPDILFPHEKSTLGEERIRDVVEAVRAERSKV